MCWVFLDKKPPAGATKWQAQISRIAKPFIVESSKIKWHKKKYVSECGRWFRSKKLWDSILDRWKCAEFTVCWTHTTVINFLICLGLIWRVDEERQSNEVWIENTILNISDTLFVNWIILKKCFSCFPILYAISFWHDFWKWALAFM